MQAWVPLCAALLTHAAVREEQTASAKRILFVPLDERFATRGLWLNLASLLDTSEYHVETPPPSVISLRKKPADLSALKSWVEDRAPGAHALVASAEMLLYGGLIASRTSNETTDTIEQRLEWVAGLRAAHGIALYVSSVVMRIPSYNSDFEEPWYWALYGQDLYSYSYHSARYDALGDRTDKDAASAARSLVPPHVVDKFLWRRARNYNVSRRALELQNGTAPFTALYVTQDDSAEYGFNVQEADGLKRLATTLGISEAVLKVYPGADEVGSALLSRLVIDDWVAEGAETAPRPTAAVVWRAANATGLVPNYESQAISATVLAQLEACGLRVIDGASKQTPDVTLLVNNFAGAPQLEASQQRDPDDVPVSDYAALEAGLPRPQNRSCVAAIADVRYSNGGDRAFVRWLMGRVKSGQDACLGAGRFAYAGWNTDGNTLGTAIANGGLLWVSAQRERVQVDASKRFTLLRFLEDLEYQSVARNRLVSYVDAAGDAVTDLATDLDFYERFSRKLLSATVAGYASALDITAPTPPGELLASVWYPWNRTFEIGLALAQASDAASDTIECSVIIAGGSTAALAAALTAADALRSSNGTHKRAYAAPVCLIEPTDWPGGQLTSSLVSAIDFGPHNRNPACLPKLFADMLASQGFPLSSPGDCWVSPICYNAGQLLQDWIEPNLASRSATLRVLRESVVSSVDVDENTGSITAVRVTSRTARDKAFAARTPFSAQVEDWYSEDDSALFTKKSVRLTGPAAHALPLVIDATEYGDVLALSGATFVQGNEISERGLASDDTCGQAFAFPFYMDAAASSESMRKRTTRAPGANYSLDNHTFADVWSYRRVGANQSLIAWGSESGDGNDYPYSYLFLPVDEAKRQRPWRGGLNVSAAAAAEAYALGFAPWFASRAPGSPPRIATGAGASGTGSGLSKVPYVRDTRRSVGLGGFRLNSSHLSAGLEFADRAGLGDYLYFDMHGMPGCKPPQPEGKLQPYTLPLRALTNERVGNLLVAGKTMAQTAVANEATRLHPVEWVSGTAAGVLAAHIVAQGGVERAPVSKVVAACAQSDAPCDVQRALSALGPISWKDCKASPTN